MCKLLMACVTDAGQNSQGSEVFSTDTALTSSNSLHVSHLLQLEGPHSAGLGRTAQLPIGWMDGSHQPCQVVVHINLPRCLCSAVVAQVHSKQADDKEQRGVTKGWEVHKKESSVFLMTSSQVNANMGTPTALGRPVSSKHFNRVFVNNCVNISNAQHISDGLPRRDSLGPLPFNIIPVRCLRLLDFLASSNAACSFLENGTFKMLHTQQ